MSPDVNNSMSPAKCGTSLEDSEPPSGTSIKFSPGEKSSTSLSKSSATVEESEPPSRTSFLFSPGDRSGTSLTKSHTSIQFDSEMPSSEPSARTFNSTLSDKQGTSSSVNLALYSTTKEFGEEELQALTYSHLKEKLEGDQYWYVSSQQEHMRAGAKVLFLGISAYACFHTLALFRRFQQDDQCTLVVDSARGFAILLESVFAFLVLVALCFPRRNVYYGVLCVVCLYCATWSLLPISPTCDERISYATCTQRSIDYENAVQLECSPQGTTAMRLNIVTIIASPAFVPHLKATVVFVCGFLVFYVLTTIVHQLVFSDYYDVVDCFINLLLLAGAAAIALRKRRSIQRKELQFFIGNYRRLHATRRVHLLLKNMVPEHIVPRLLEAWLEEPAKLIADSLDRVSVLFMVIADFDKHVRSLQPAKLLKFLNRIFTGIDAVCAARGVTKIETVGEEYVAAVGVEPDDQDIGHQACLGKLIEMTLEVFELQHDEGIQIRMGIHTGPVVAGVIGQKLPRFRLFGDTVNTAARMMQKGVDGELQFGIETRSALPPWVKTRYRGEIEMKGKGQVMAYLLNRVATEVCKENGFMELPEIEKHDSKLSRVSFAEDDERFSIRDSISSGATDRGIQRADSPQASPGAISIGSISSDQPSITRDSQSGQSIKSATSSASLAGIVRHVSEKMTEQMREADDVRCSWSCAYLTKQLLPKFSLSRLTWSYTHLTPAQHKNWLKYFYSSRVWRKSRQHAVSQAIIVMAVTAVESIIATYQQVFKDVHILNAFIVARTLLLIALLLWAAIAGHGTWARERPRIVEGCRLLSLCLATVFVSVSYNALLLAQETPRGMSADQIKSFVSDRSYRVNIWTSMLLLSYSALMINLSLRFSLALVAAVACLSIMNIVRSIYSDKSFGSDFAAEFCLLCMSAQFARGDEQSSRNEFKVSLAIDIANERIENLLKMLLPPMIVCDLTAQEAKAALPSHRYTRATIAQSDLVGFTKLASTRRPDEVIQIVGDLFGLFDELTDTYGVYKVETVGDAYIAGQAEQPLTSTHRALDVVRFAIRIVEVTQQWSRDNKEEVDCRVGVHFGSCTGGIVGRRMRRYHLFGKLLTELELLESTAPAGRVQISRACWHAIIEEGLPAEVLDFEERLQTWLVTSKGDIVEYGDVGGGPTLLAQAYDAECHRRILGNGSVEKPPSASKQSGKEVYPVILVTI